MSSAVESTTSPDEDGGKVIPFEEYYEKYRTAGLRDYESTTSPSLQTNISETRSEPFTYANQIEAAAKAFANRSGTLPSSFLMKSAFEVQAKLSKYPGQLGMMAKAASNLNQLSAIMARNPIQDPKEIPITSCKQKGAPEVSDQNYVSEKTLDAYLKGIDEKIDAKIETMGAKMDAFLNEMRIRDEARSSDIKLIREDVRSIKESNKHGIWAMWGIAVSILVSVVAMVLTVIHSNTQIVGTIAQIVDK